MRAHHNVFNWIFQWGNYGNLASQKACELVKSIILWTNPFENLWSADVRSFDKVATKAEVRSSFGNWQPIDKVVHPTSLPACLLFLHVFSMCIYVHIYMYICYINIYMFSLQRLIFQCYSDTTVTQNCCYCIDTTESSTRNSSKKNKHNQQMQQTTKITK